MPSGSLGVRAKRGQLDLVREGDISVQIIRPFDPALPSGLRWGWSFSKFNDREQFRLERRPVELIRVHYTLHTDPVMLRALEHRANLNKSGNAVRGLARAEAGHAATVDLAEPIVRNLVKRAANNDSHRVTDGPVHIAIKLLEAQTGTPPTCEACGKILAEHERQGEAKHGARNPETNLWEADYPYVETHYLCPLEVQS